MDNKYFYRNWGVTLEVSEQNYVRIVVQQTQIPTSKNLTIASLQVRWAVAEYSLDLP